jgi:hypothetical protein
MAKLRITVFLFLTFFPGLTSVLLASKIDTIYFHNGDRITAEVKSLENNQLRLSTDDAGSIVVEWDKVDSVKILNTMRILMKDGQIFYGKLVPSGTLKSCYIWTREGDPRLADLQTIVSLSPVEERFFDRMTGTISSGFSYTKASQVMQFNLNGSIKYLAEKNHIELYYDGIFTSESEVNTQRQNGGVNLKRILPRKWFLVSHLTGETNSEQELDLRTSFGLGGGNSIVRTNYTNFYAALGVQANREASMGTDQYNLEALVSIDYSVFIYDSPVVTINLGGDLIPSLSDLGRVRCQVDSNLKWEVFKDFYLKWTFYYSFDSRPLSTTAERSDWAISLLGFEYKL